MVLQGHFKCDAVNSVFIHPDRICDGSKDCPHGTDEMNCHVTCAEGFICAGGFVVAGDYNRSKSLTNVSFIDPRTRMVELSHMNVSMVLTQLCGLKLIYLIDLRLSNCSLDDLLVRSTCFPRLSKLDLSFNLIRSISTDESTNMLTIYHGAKSLHSLNLSHNIFLEDFDTATLASNLNLRVLDLSHTAISTFPDMHSMTLTLTHLNLSHTRITKLWAGTFPTAPISRPLEILDLRGADIEDVQLVALKGLKIKTHLYSDCFKLCCPQLTWDIPTHVCHAPTDPVSSCSSLIKEKLLNILVWMAGVVSVLGNTGVIVKYLATGRSNLHLSHGQLVIELAMSNLLMGIYLLIIASETIRFNGDYVLHDNQWRQSDMCKAAEFLYSLSSLVSPAFILLLVVDRYLAINNPLQQRPFSSGYILAFSILTWCLGLTLAAVPLLPWTHHWNVYSSNAACVRLPLLANRHPGWEATTATYIILNCLICLGIASAQFATFIAASAARKALTSNTYFIQHGDISTKTMQELALSRRVATITFTNLPCYLLIGVLGLLALGGHAVGRDAFVWLVLVILPGTSAINPVLYSLPMVQNLLAKTIAKRMASQGPMSQESPSSSRT
ncbi:hypothetical protein EGW08_014006 [Elysia chlorotica]|uniref:G-protein coupled receptors family 1 profile domain-containing protein n=1 Tax=Elysia chlorotica TaxID=188477 RepID=A0A3S1HFD0_ELYCH|nr:hypothetical protein EGW08_014006 [Elysia chlorotica]